MAERPVTIGKMVRNFISFPQAATADNRCASMLHGIADAEAA
jgi:hypothetical protein